MNERRVFVTGGSGFVGRYLLRALSGSNTFAVTALDRSGRLAAAAPSGVGIIAGDINTPALYQSELRGCQCVVHLAAATGNATQASHERDTVAGTIALLEACRAADVEAILLVSSIAVSFPDTKGYPYAVAKARAEQAVATSGLRHTILRPTMIFGEGSPIQRSLTGLATLPRIVMPGNGRVRVQPIAVQDVVRAIVLLLEQDRFLGETIEIGGPSALTMEELLRRIRLVRIGRDGRAWHVPLAPIQAALRAAEGLGLGALLPVTAGQLTSFRENGTVRPNSLQEELAPALVPLERMLTPEHGA